MTLSPALRAWLVDAGERLGATFGEAFLGSFILNGGFTALLNGHLDRVAVNAAAAAGIAAVVALLKVVIAAKFSGTVSPASLAPQQQPGQAVSDAPGPPEGDAETGRQFTVTSNSHGTLPVVRTVVLAEKPVKGKRLGRHISHDSRSRAYAVTPTAAPLVSVRHHRHVPVYDQGNIGSCVAHAGKGALSTAPFHRRFSSEHAIVQTYAELTATDDVPGQWPPDDTGSDALSFAKLAVRHKWCSSYSHCFSLDAVLTALQTGPVMLGVSWRSGFDQPTADGQMRYTGQVRGGHEIVADEIDVENKRVWITNSWGSTFGVSGRAFWSWDDLAKILADNGDATVLNP